MKDKIMFVLGIVYISLGILNLFNAVYYQHQSDMIWFCSIGLLLIGIGLFARNKELIQSQVYILFIPNLIWTIDFLSYLFRGHSLFGMIDYFFIPGPYLPKLVSLQHVFTLPLIIFLLYNNKFTKNKIWIISYAEWLAVFILARAFTSPEENINYVYHFGGQLSGIQIPNNIYPVAWIIVGFIMIYATHLLIVKLSEVTKKPSRR